MKRPTMLVQALLSQMEVDLDLSVERDQQVIAERCKHEGLSFLTITLPQLSDALERGIETGTFTCPSSFRRHGSLPRFMGGFFKRVFSMDGRLLPEPCPYTIAGIRQVCRFFKKLKLECTPRREAKAAQHYLDVEGELRMLTSQVERKDILLDKISRTLWAQVFPELDSLDLICHHGPGFTADRISTNSRYRLRKWNQRSEYSYPSDFHAYPNFGEAAEAAGIGASNERSLKYLRLLEEEPVRVVFVPKTQMTPRVISIEPSHMMYIQQGLKSHIYSVLESHRLTKRSIRFTRQDVNQRLAYSSSIDRRLATLDLKDASDRVHSHLVRRIFKTSGLADYLDDARSLHAVLPDGRNVILSKYASQGSALCFPVEAMVFYTLILRAMHAQDGMYPCSRSISNYSKLIDIYGDDIIVPVEYTDSVVQTLESYLLKVNVSKSFRHSLFRESCGGDFFNGVSVSPVYAREVPHDSARSWEPSSIMSWAATADLFYTRGQWKIAQVIRDMVREVVRRPIPRAQSFGPGVAFFSYIFTTGLRWNRELQCFKQKRVQFQPTLKKDEIDGDSVACLNKWGINAERRLASSDPYVCGPIRLGESVCSTVADANGSLQQRDLRVDAVVPGEGTQNVRPILRGAGNSFPVIDPVWAAYARDSSRHDFGSKSALSQLYQTDQVIDFRSSVKRGGFKSKHRWVTFS